ncbi:Asp-tRNA(Asn)/Glu-tRNA(Gln) amidotransferase subunit GatB [Methylacidiphilum caldifontis]|uniref:Aspartyl/glutamyl-tRNA(Asn/Gln) amidotransferase subunit B n=1 Tax=Methylacidiphilum caldifontis TaxID=2795386 RepID=A0A4Y8PGY5_9BACT|nr:Asp-tRNA(Asn)/Glu-tRNA(Gln) amidotransferase subunit GatB [Methylacidiphilum caldifontis]QSR88480.1 Asp-tRNA(Asn)/Glu-tRNA(Gln) amidotransferase subunit GatB [Methylacidiphilum caldifontis]TFE71308.1 glutaminyl-tRNA synthase (glutamine-hydrolyzing) subunit B [Methylacidiphilum caldifontis]
MDYEAIIGLEVHVQLKTQTKLFCGCTVEYGADPNSRVCPVCLGLPGALPSPNKQAIILTIQTGLMLGSEISPRGKFDRKNYFYPDMPKNYQISQYDQPLCKGGYIQLYPLAFPKDAQKDPQAQIRKKIRIVRVHLEEDVGKSFHFEENSGIDFNRAGTPLMEIVSEADIRSPEEAFAYLSALRQILRYGNVSDCDMEKGQLRCDVNVSVKPVGEEKWGTKCEIKNLNSISAVRKALKYEIQRQIQVLSMGNKIEQETLRWDDQRGQTILMRTKEYAHDYRYFPDPDLLTVVTEGELIEEAKKRIPELPEQKKQRLCETYGLSEYQSSVLAADPQLADYFEKAAKSASNKVAVANFLINDYLALVSDFETAIPLPAEYFSELSNLVDQGQVHMKQAKEMVKVMVSEKKRPSVIVQEQGLGQITSVDMLEALCKEAIDANPKSVSDYRAGKVAALNALKGYVMKKTKGKANPQIIHDLLEKKLREIT